MFFRNSKILIQFLIFNQARFTNQKPFSSGIQMTILGGVSSIIAYMVASFLSKYEQEKKI